MIGASVTSPWVVERRGRVAIAAGVFEVGAIFLAGGWWKLLHVVLAIVYIVAGSVAFIHPGDTFAALAAIFNSGSGSKKAIVAPSRGPEKRPV